MNEQQFKMRDASSYDDVAEQYHRFSERCTMPFVRQLLTMAHITPSSRILDVGTGTGIVAMAAASALGKGGQVVAIDLSAGMLTHAKARADARQMGERLVFCRMDAEAMAFAERSFDIVVSLFALRHLPHPDAALRHIYRVLRPGGRVVIGVGSSVPLLHWQGMIHGIRRIPDIIARKRGRQLVAPHFLLQLVDKHLPGAVEEEEPSWCNRHPSRLIPQMIQRAGFVDLHRLWRGHQENLANADEFWQLQSTFTTSARKRMAMASAQQMAPLLQEFGEICNEVIAHGGRLVYPCGAFLASARRPSAR